MLDHVNDLQVLRLNELISLLPRHKKDLTDGVAAPILAEVEGRVISHAFDGMELVNCEASFEPENAPLASGPF